MQHEALAVVERHAHVPLLPGDAAAVDGEGWALRLHHMQRLQACMRMRQRQRSIRSTILMQSRLMQSRPKCDNYEG